MTMLRTSLPLLATLAACAMEETPIDRLPSCMETSAVDDAGVVSHWVVDSVSVPLTPNEIDQSSLNVDCDVQDRPDNAVGSLLSLVYRVESSDLNDEIAALLDDGRLIHLLSLQARSTADADGVGLTVRLGIDLDGDPADNFAGGELFAIDEAGGAGDLTGAIVDGRLTARGPRLPIGVTLPSLDEVVVLPLEAVRIDATVGPDRITGRIGGAIRVEVLEQQVVPVVHAALVRAIERDCLDGVCQPDSFGDVLLRNFDGNRDGVLALDEFRTSEAIDAFLQPDVDLYDAEGELEPRVDGDLDSLSLGLTFSAVPARIGG